jgi:hypothetical protein
MKLIALLLIAITCASCSTGTMAPTATDVEFVWGQRRIIGLEVPLGRIKPGLGIWVTRPTDGDVEVTTVEK